MGVNQRYSTVRYERGRVYNLNGCDYGCLGLYDDNTVKFAELPPRTFGMREMHFYSDGQRILVLKNPHSSKDAALDIETRKLSESEKKDAISAENQRRQLLN